jgi:spiro-SPASM protein
MNGLAVLYGGSLNQTAFENVLAEKSAFECTQEKAALLPEVRKSIVLTDEPTAPECALESVVRNVWTKRILLETLAAVSKGFDFLYFVWADCPLLDPALAAALAKRHCAYRADYSFADGYPQGFAPEILSATTAERLLKLAFDDGPVERDALFSVLQKDINAFDIETEIAPVDFRSFRLLFAADSKRNLLLIRRFVEAGFSTAADVGRFVAETPALLRTLPAFYPIQVAAPCPQSCAICPYPAEARTEKNYMPPERFEQTLDKIEAFSGDAVIDLSLWGELSLHPQKIGLIGAVLARSALSLVIETSGIGWKADELVLLANTAGAAAARENRMPPLSWIVSLDAFDAKRYREVRGAGMVEALETVKTLAGLFPNTYVQAVRVSGAEDDIEQFYRYWKSAGIKVIIQKYDDFCGLLPARRVSDLSPLERRPCWHLMRDMPVLIDGRVPYCREDALKGAVLGNVFSEDLAAMWARGDALYQKHCAGAYPELCTVCDEYYTYNF